MSLPPWDPPPLPIEDRRPPEVPDSPAPLAAGELVPGPRGGQLRRGSKKGNTPGTGRPRDEFKEFLAGLTGSKKFRREMKRALEGEYGPHFVLKAAEYVADRAFGKPTQAVELSGPDGEPLVKVHIGTAWEDV